MSETRWQVEFKARGERRYRSSLSTDGFATEQEAMEFARQAAERTPKIGVRVVKVTREVIWTATQGPATQREGEGG